MRGDEQRIWVECGAAEVVALLRAEKYGSACTRHRVTEIHNKLRHLTVKISHTPKVGNKVANWLALQGRGENSLTEFDHITATSMVKAMSRMDQLGIPNFCFDGN